MQKLPDDLIVNCVFFYLEVSDLGRIARVCKHWSSLSYSKVLWTYNGAEKNVENANNVKEAYKITKILCKHRFRLLRVLNHRNTQQKEGKLAVKGWFNIWTNYYCIVNSGQLKMSYISAQKCIDLLKSKVTVIDNLTFCIVDEKGKELFLRANSYEDALDWIESLSEQNQYISRPNRIVHLNHVQYSNDKGFSGFPREWESPFFHN